MIHPDLHKRLDQKPELKALSGVIGPIDEDGVF